MFDFYQRALPRLAARGALRLSFARDGERDVGYVLGGVLGDTYRGLQLSYDADYQPPFPLTARLHKLTIRVDRPQLSPADIEKLEAAQRNNKMSE